MNASELRQLKNDLVLMSWAATVLRDNIQKTESDGSVWIKIGDDGIGFGDELQRKLFCLCPDAVSRHWKEIAVLVEIQMLENQKNIAEQRLKTLRQNNKEKL